jgi:hypothetical protein
LAVADDGQVLESPCLEVVDNLTARYMFGQSRRSVLTTYPAPADLGLFSTCRDRYASLRESQFSD